MEITSSLVSFFLSFLPSSFNCAWIDGFWNDGFQIHDFKFLDLLGVTKFKWITDSLYIKLSNLSSNCCKFWIQPKCVIEINSSNLSPNPDQIHQSKHNLTHSCIYLNEFLTQNFFIHLCKLKFFVHFCSLKALNNRCIFLAGIPYFFLSFGLFQIRNFPSQVSRSSLDDHDGMHGQKLLTDIFRRKQKSTHKAISLPSSPHHFSNQASTGSEPAEVFTSSNMTSAFDKVLESSTILNKPLLPFQEWNIDFSEITIGTRVGIGTLCLGIVHY